MNCSKKEMSPNQPNPPPQTDETIMTAIGTIEVTVIAVVDIALQTQEVAIEALLEIIVDVAGEEDIDTRLFYHSIYSIAFVLYSDYREMSI
jgi:hypothetical protein